MVAHPAKNPLTLNKLLSRCSPVRALRLVVSLDGNSITELMERVNRGCAKFTWRDSYSLVAELGGSGFCRTNVWPIARVWWGTNFREFDFRAAILMNFARYSDETGTKSRYSVELAQKGLTAVGENTVQDDGIVGYTSIKIRSEDRGWRALVNGITLRLLISWQFALEGSSKVGQWRTKREQSRAQSYINGWEVAVRLSRVRAGSWANVTTHVLGEFVS